MPTSVASLGGRAAAAAAVLVLLIAGFAIAGSEGGPLSLFAAEEGEPCTTDTTVPGRTDSTVLGTTDGTVPCGGDSDPTTSTTDSPTTPPTAGTNPTSSTRPATTPPTRATSTTPPTTVSDRPDGASRQVARDYATAARQWLRCAARGGSGCGPAPTPDDYGLTDEVIASLGSNVASRIDRVASQIACFDGSGAGCQVQRRSSRGTTPTTTGPVERPERRPGR